MWRIIVVLVIIELLLCSKQILQIQIMSFVLFFVLDTCGLIMMLRCGGWRYEQLADPMKEEMSAIVFRLCCGRRKDDDGRSSFGAAGKGGIAHKRAFRCIIITIFIRVCECLFFWVYCSDWLWIDVWESVFFLSLNLELASSVAGVCFIRSPAICLVIYFVRHFRTILVRAYWLMRGALYCYLLWLLLLFLTDRFLKREQGKTWSWAIHTAARLTFNHPYFDLPKQVWIAQMYDTHRRHCVCEYNDCVVRVSSAKAEKEAKRTTKSPAWPSCGYSFYS